MKNFKELRKKYTKFIYRDYSISEDENSIKIEYFFEISNLSIFKPTIEIEKRNIVFKSVDNDFVRNLAFNIGMIELISYWKCVCPKKVIVECGALNKEQIAWFKKLYYFGLRRI